MVKVFILQQSDDQFKCRLCIFSNAHATVVRRHYVTNHHNKLPVVCGYNDCRRRLDLGSDEDMRAHFATQHSSSPVLVNCFTLKSTTATTDAPLYPDVTASCPLTLAPDVIVVTEVVSLVAENDWLEATRAMLEKDGSGVYKCRFCVFARRNLDLMQAHIFTKHDVRNIFECVYCSFGHNKVCPSL